MTKVGFAHSVVPWHRAHLAREKQAYLDVTCRDVEGLGCHIIIPPSTAGNVAVPTTSRPTAHIWAGKPPPPGPVLHNVFIFNVAAGTNMAGMLAGWVVAMVR
ncbi:hypothetical protein N7474_007945 [Penicillium riverlandense]|uniref:uncharacterized protein n=1 Tax=Penicillium riverlandense TaxID=1903569 RepID=UPI002546A036|nr:uncharacterized protein N7474_007945 [Penicillium riverlandense]KAJ5811644.1 hypothetical protein N7474_007945 [Penicillium riverlandense]